MHVYFRCLGGGSRSAGGGEDPAVWGILLWEARVCSFCWGEPARLTHQKTITPQSTFYFRCLGVGISQCRGGGSRGVGWDPPVGGSPPMQYTQAPVFVWFDGTSIVYYYPLNYILLQCLLLCYASWLCMVVNISVQYNGGLLPDIILLTQGNYNRRTRLNTMQRLCLYSL